MLSAEHKPQEQSPGIALALFSPSKLSAIRCGRDDSRQPGEKDCQTSCSMQTVPVQSTEYACRVQNLPARAQRGALAWQGCVATLTCTHASVEGTR